MNAAEREVLRALTDDGAAVHAYAISGERYRAECAYCSAQDVYAADAGGIDLESFPHAPDCPITTARALLRQEPPPPTPYEAWQSAVLAAAERVADKWESVTGGGGFTASQWRDAGEALVDVALERPAKEQSE